MEKTYFILNPYAGGGRASVRWQSIEPLVKKKLPGYELLTTNSPGHATEICKDIALKGQSAKIISCGGDGTNNEIINGLFENEKLINPEIKIGFLPVGSGNDFTRTLKLPKETLSRLAIIEEAHCIETKVGMIRYMSASGDMAVRYFLNIFSFGISGYTGHLISKSRKNWGAKITYLANTIKGMLQFRPVSLDVICDKQNIFAGSAITVAIANGKYFGNGLKIAPRADIHHDNFEIVIIKGMSKPRVLLKFLKVLRGSHMSDPMIVSFKGKSVSATSSPQDVVYIEIDGEALGHLPISCERATDKIKILSPLNISS